MRPLIVAGNWKMNGDLAFVAEIAETLNQTMSQQANTRCLLFPPAPYLASLASQINTPTIAVGAQNMHSAECGAYTGELSASMIKEVGAKYVILGHSERRELFHETDAFIYEKLARAYESEITPILCVGETETDRENGDTEAVIERQLVKVLENVTMLSGAILAYEPVWAIGTGKTATPEEAQAVHAFIRAKVAEKDKAIADVLPVLYGGSVNKKNAESLFKQVDIDGALVGGASLKIDEFVEILTCTKYS